LPASASTFFTNLKCREQKSRRWQHNFRSHLPFGKEPTFRLLDNSPQWRYVREKDLIHLGIHMYVFGGCLKFSF
jgi:hypothetical protein